MSRHDSAAGYESVEGSLFAPVQISAKIVKNYHECAITPQIANSDFLDETELYCGAKVIYGVEQNLDLFSQDTDINEEPETHSGPAIGSASMTVCQQRKFKWKLSHHDKRIMCNNYDKWEANLRNNIDKSIKRLVDAYSIPKIIASAHPDNVGLRAGKETHTINLGNQTAEGALPGNSVSGFEEMILSLRDAAQESGMMCTEAEQEYGGDSAMPIIVIPAKLERYALKLMKELDTCCSDKNAMRTGLIGEIYGFKIISTQQLAPVKTGGILTSEVMLIDPMQVQHAFDIVTNKWWEGMFEDYLVGEFVWETQVYNPYGIVIATSKV